MRLGFIIYGDLSITSGGYLYDRQLVRYLQGQGDEVEVILLPWRDYGRHLLDNLRLKLMQRLRHSDIDILLQDELNHPSLFWLNNRLRAHITYPIISIIHHLRSSEQHPNWQLKLYRRVERSYLQSVDGFVFNSKTTRATVKALSGEEKPNIVAYPAGNHLANNAVTQTSILERAQRGGSLRVLFVGNVAPRKGLHLLLAALAKVPQEMWQLDVVGDLDMNSKYAGHLIKSADSSGLSANITWHGRLPDAALSSKMARSHLLVIPSSYEGFGIAYLEGMHYGLPAIGTTSGAAHEIINNGQNGFLIAPDDAGSLAHQIKTIYKDRRLLAQMGIAALERSRTHPTWDTSMHNVRKFLLGVRHLKSVLP